MNELVSKEDLLRYQLISGAIMLGIITFALVSYFISPISELDNQVKKILSFAVPLIVIAGYFIAKRVHEAKLEKIKSSPEESRHAEYLVAMVFYLALLEFTAIIACVATMLTGDTIYLWLVAIILFAMLIKFPTKDRIMDIMRKRGLYNYKM